MTGIDFFVFGIYMAGILAVGYYFFRKNRSAEDFYVGGRTMSPVHVGLSIAATDVGGGFSIGLGGLGYMMGLSGSWLLFTGIVGAWITAVVMIPRVKAIDVDQKLMTYPDFLRGRYDHRVATLAAVISALGYMGFTGGQVLAGAKLASVTIVPGNVLGLDPFTVSLYTISFVMIAYTVMGGLKAVIYTDTIQWSVLFFGLIFLAIPFALLEVGGISGLMQKLPPGHFSLANISKTQFFNWMITIVPVWFVAMTIYQRIYACRSVREARTAWYIGGLFEYPVMAFTGAFLGLCSRAIFTGIEPELGLPMLIRDVLPSGVAGIVVASYFSAIMSTADSCLVASSGNIVNDLLQRSMLRGADGKTVMRASRWVTLLLGISAVVVAGSFQTVLDAILYTYSFLVSGLFVPTLGALFWKKSSSTGALAAMIGGGGTTIGLQLTNVAIPMELDPVFPGMMVSLLLFVGLSLYHGHNGRE